MAKRVIKVFEWETLAVGGDFSAKQFDSLVLWQESQVDDYFKVGHRKITFLQWVGVIQAGSLVIEVLPKAGKSGSHEEWRLVLLRMLQHCGHLKIRQSQNTDLSVRNQSLFDLYYQNYVEEVETLVHRGIVKKYRVEATNRKSLKGKLIFSQQISRNLVHKERFYTEAKVYDRENIWNKILLAALQVTSLKTGIGLTRAKSKNLELNFPDFSLRKFTNEDFNCLHYDRKTEDYRKSIQLARLILLNLNPQMKSGHEQVSAILFDMNVLWEEWLLSRFRFYNRDESSVSILGKRRCCFWKNDDHESKWLETDILLELNGKKHVVFDAKWKCPKDHKPGDNDLKQMFAYNLMWNSSEAWLVYPKTEFSCENYVGKFQYTGKALTAGVMFINPLEKDSDKLKSSFLLKDFGQN